MSECVCLTSIRELVNLPAAPSSHRRASFSSPYTHGDTKAHLSGVHAHEKLTFLSPPRKLANKHSSLPPLSLLSNPHCCFSRGVDTRAFALKGRVATRPAYSNAATRSVTVLTCVYMFVAPNARLSVSSLFPLLHFVASFLHCRECLLFKKRGNIFFLLESLSLSVCRRRSVLSSLFFFACLASPVGDAFLSFFSAPQLLCRLPFLTSLFVSPFFLICAAFSCFPSVQSSHPRRRPFFFFPGRPPPPSHHASTVYAFHAVPFVSFFSSLASLPPPDAAQRAACAPVSSGMHVYALGWQSERKREGQRGHNRISRTGRKRGAPTYSRAKEKGMCLSVDGLHCRSLPASSATSHAVSVYVWQEKNEEEERGTALGFLRFSVLPLPPLLFFCAPFPSLPPILLLPCLFLCFCLY